MSLLILFSIAKKVSQKMLWVSILLLTQNILFAKLPQAIPLTEHTLLILAHQNKPCVYRTLSMPIVAILVFLLFYDSLCRDISLRLLFILYF
jgi:hypothetical protein